MASRRRRHLVHKRIQLALAIQALRHWLLFLVALAGLLCGLEYFNNEGQVAMGDCAVRVWRRFGPAFVVLISLLPAIIYDSIKVSNRFIGPLTRLRNVMRSAAQGEAVEPLKCRRNDYSADFFEALNELLERMRHLEQQSRQSSSTADAAEAAEWLTAEPQTSHQL